MEKIISRVLILVVMEDGLVRLMVQGTGAEDKCLNPCCNGRWSRTNQTTRVTVTLLRS